MFCIKCGKPAEAGNFCLSCFLQKNELFRINDFKLKVCDCGAYYDSRWQQPVKDLIKSQIEKRIITKNRITRLKIRTRHAGNKIIADIEACGLIMPEKIKKTEKKNIKITLKSQKCDNCIKLSGGYYEAVIQIRGANAPKILSMTKNLAGNDLVKIEHDVNGYDLRLMKKSAAKRAANSLKKHYSVKESFKLITTKDGRKLYRNYYAVR